tara:strand:- start:494 stop:1066 length:573 start_codon:yes stop_codon:yes gene_type:complete
MAPNASISEDTNARLQAIATPLVDTHDSVIARLLDHWEKTKGSAPKISKPGQPVSTMEDGKLVFEPSNLPSLGFTTPKQIVIDGVQLPKSDTYWNSMLNFIIRLIHAKGKDANAIVSMMNIANAALGMKNDNGYKFLPDVGLSVQGQDSNAAFRQAYELAITNGIKGNVFFFWQNNEKAAFPNMPGYIEF